MVKWYFIAIAVVFGLDMAATAYSDHEKSQCRIVAMQNHMPVDQIE